jgi:hypothetical protein
MGVDEGMMPVTVVEVSFPTSSPDRSFRIFL